MAPQGPYTKQLKNNIKIKKVKKHNLTVGSQVERWKLFCVAFAARKVKKTRCKHTRSNLRNQFRYRVLCLKGHQGDRLSGLQSQPMTARLVRNYFHGFCDMRSYHNINGVFSNVLSGGAHGAHVTKRKQLNRQNESNSEESLAASLQTFLQKWDNEKPTKKKRTGTKPTQQDHSLAKQLRGVIQTCVNDGQRDQVVAQKIKASLSQWQRGNAWTKASWSDTWVTNQTERDGSIWYASQNHPTNGKRIETPANPNYGPRAKRPRVSAVDTGRSVTAQIGSDETRTVRSPLPIGLVINEWTVPPKIISKNALVLAVRKGETVPGNFVFVPEDEAAQELKDLWQGLKLQTPVTVARMGSHGGLGATFVATSVKMPGAQNYSLQTMATWRLGNEKGMIKRKDAKATDLAKWNPTEKVFIRISAPTHYRAAFLHDGKEDSTSRILSTLASWQQVSVSLLTGGSWKWEWGKCSKQLVGHLKMSSDICKTTGSWVRETWNFCDQN